MKNSVVYGTPVASEKDLIKLVHGVIVSYKTTALTGTCAISSRDERKNHYSDFSPVIIKGLSLQ